MKLWKRQINFALLFCLCGIVNAEQMLPEDEAVRDLSLLEFRKNLLKAVETKDVTSFMALVDEKVSVSSKGRGGHEAFKKAWNPELPESELWQVLKPIINMGGTFVRSERGVEFCAPYVFTNFPSHLDIYGHAVITKDNVLLKSGPSNSTSTVRKLSYDVVQIKDWRSVKDALGGEIRWLKVKTLSGQDGYIDKTILRSPSDYAACFLQRSGKDWKLISLITNE